MVEKVWIEGWLKAMPILRTPIHQARFKVRPVPVPERLWLPHWPLAAPASMDMAVPSEFAAGYVGAWNENTIACEVDISWKEYALANGSWE